MDIESRKRSSGRMNVGTDGGNRYVSADYSRTVYPRVKPIEVLIATGNRLGGGDSDNAREIFTRPSPVRREEGENMGRQEPKDAAIKLEIKEKLVKKERTRLQKLYQNIPENQKKLVEGLIIQAARLRVLLDEMWIDISENGDYELFSQSEKQEPYERERPVAKLYNSRNDSYYRIIKQLSDILPEGECDPKDSPADGSGLL